MDLDSFIASHSAEWARLDALARRRRLDGAEADELVVRYKRVATHLALVQSRAPDPMLAARLSGLLSRARAATVGGSRASGWAALARGVTVDFPVAVYRTWRWSVLTAAANVAVAAAMMLWLRAHPDRINRLLSSDQIRQLVDHDFSDYYSAHPARSFAAQVWTNNALVAAMALFLGVTLVGTLYLLWSNAVNLGVVGGAMLGAGKANVFFGLILPHGLLELTAVFVAGGIGLRTGLGLGGAGRTAPGPGLGRGRAGGRGRRAGAGRRVAGVRRHRSVRHAVGPADRGPDRHRGGRRGGVPDLCRRAGPPRGAGRGHRRSGGRRARGRPPRRLTPGSPPNPRFDPASVAGRVWLRR